MSDPSDETIKTYLENFSKYAERTPAIPGNEFQEWMNAFLSFLPLSPTIFELGSATGRDAQYFKSKGADVLCTDVVPEVLDLLSKSGFKTHLYDFRNDPNPEWIGKFDGVFANAVLLHAPPEIFDSVLKNILKILKKGGHFAFSVKTGKGDEITFEKMDAPRYYKYYLREELTEIVLRLGYTIVDMRTAENNKWLQIIAAK